MTDEPTEIDANQSADPIGTVVPDSETPSNTVEREYDASAIQVLEGLDAVRKRPGMYIGSTGERGLHHLVTEVVDNAVDEAMAGVCDRIVVTMLQDGGIRVEDNGRGIPVGIVESEGKPAVTVVLTVLHAGGKFGGGGYKVSGGLHGVGVSVVNALSTRLKVDVKQNGREYTQSFTMGVPDEELAEVGPSDEHGTTITFWANPDIFETTTYSYETLSTRFREMAFLNKGLELVIRDERPDHTEDGNPVEQSFKYDNGLVDYVKYLTGIRETVHRDVISFEASAGENSMSLEVALQWSGSFQESVHTFANAINTHEGGTHEEGFRAALTSLVNSFGEDQGMIKKKEDRLTGDDIREGLTAIISVKLADPQFEGQTKTKLGNTEVKGFVQRVVNDRLGAWFEQNPAEGREIIRKATAAASARIAARKARDLARNRKGLLGGGGLPGKLADCQSTNPEECEVYIVEGDSAGGSAKGGRDPKFQAILPIRGKILNVEKARIDKVLQNNEVQAIISALGTGIHEDFDEDKLRYHKIVLMADADVDGQHIRTLLLTLLFRFMRPLIERGHVYAAQPPLYKIRWTNATHELAYTEREKDGLLEAGFEAGKKLPKENATQRYKGLGEMNAQELWETTMDPANRVLLQITLDDAVRADETFQTLMGDDIEARRNFIQRNAKDVRFLDI
ncbi:DNA topoisomerase (ATP-hydrolyzing) subunit B [Kribbella turkmenica]|uniref:DNA gyrase subunit B n=1 Tax=Kribbella turkmenica TaxID=2530375 RepID=A0A4R4WHF7_9ACTN|nr:DNA topoisomerase (ATP-hydrolyzing) subunit B [Kribbella turkmenica]TDD18459.1 DNA topoisomerase (ATP-hydrolyzing) subunit B [Kribbella turkmenica]